MFFRKNTKLTFHNLSFFSRGGPKKMDWYYFNPRVLNKPAGKALEARIMGSVPPQKGKITVPLKNVITFPYQALLFTMDLETMFPKDVRPRSITLKYLRALYASLEEAPHIMDGPVVKKVFLPRGKGVNVPYKSIFDVPTEALDRFPQIRWAFRALAIPLLSFYPMQVLSCLNPRQTTAIQNLVVSGHDSIHLWAAMVKSIPFLPHFLGLKSRATDLPVEVVLAQNTWVEMMRRYEWTGQRVFDKRVFETKLGEWGVVNAEGEITLWQEQEADFREAFKWNPMEIISAENAFTLSYYELIDSLCSKTTMIICPGEQERLIHADNLAATVRTFDDCWLNTVPKMDSIVVVLSERITLLQWLDLFTRAKVLSVKLALIGDPECRLRICDRGSPMDGFALACQMREPDQILCWPMFESNDEMCRQFQAAQTLRSGETPANVNVIARSGALLSVLDRISSGKTPYCIPNDTAVLCFHPTTVKMIRSLHVPFSPSTPVVVSVYGEHGPLTAFHKEKEMATLGKKEISIAWPGKLERLNVIEAYRYTGLPVKNLFLVIEEDTSRADIVSCLKYGTANCTLIMDSPFICRMMPE